MSAWSRLAAVVVGLGMLLGLAAGRAAADTILYSEPSTFPISGGTGIYFSQSDTSLPPNANQPANFTSGDLYQLAFNNFTLSQAAAITGVQWQGGYNSGPGIAPVTGQITAFTLGIWSNTAGKDIFGTPGNLPGTLLASITIPGNANETLAAPMNANGSNEQGSNGPNLIFNYSASLPANFFTANPGTEYWLSIFPDLNSSVAGNWGWHAGTGTTVLEVFDPAFDTPGFYIKPPDSSPNLSLSNDLAFALIGTGVPEPSSLALLGLGIAALAGWHRSRKKRGLA